MEARAQSPNLATSARRAFEPIRAPVQPLSAVLFELSEAATDSLSVTELVAVLGDRSVGAALLILALPATLMPPGVAAILGAPLLVISAQLVIRRQKIWLPSQLGQLRLKREHLAPAMARSARMVARLETTLRPRLAGLQHSWHDRLIGVGCMGLSTVLILPAPIAHTAAGLGIAAFAAGMLQRDGVALLAGWAFAAACATLMALLVGGAVLGLRML